MSYHKYPGEDWREEEFQRCEVQMPSGDVNATQDPLIFAEY